MPAHAPSRPEATPKGILAHAPADAGALVSLAVECRTAGDARAAVDWAERALRQEPGDVASLVELGRAWCALGRPGIAFLPLTTAVERAPADGEARIELARALIGLGRYVPAADELAAALDLPNAGEEAQHLLASVLYRLHLAGDRAAVAARTRAWIDRFPDHPVARHAGSALTGTNPPPQASADWVRTTFDRSSPGFDTHLSWLGYSVPGELASLLNRHGPLPASAEVLDIGCGTGLCGPHLRPLACRLVGVDLSAGMLSEAARKGVYDELVEAELTEFLHAAPSSWDVIVAADVLIYIGDLHALLAAAAAALRPDGLFACSIEQAQAAGWELHPSGRYRHHSTYLVDVAATVGLETRAVEPTTIRLENGTPVEGRLILIRQTRFRSAG